MSAIPGLDVVCPVTENENEDCVELVSFTGTFRIPKSLNYGGCRRNVEFEKIVCLKASSSWIYWKCKNVRRHECVCVKKAKNVDLSSNENDLAALIREIQILTNLKHDNIMQFYEPVVGETNEKSPENSSKEDDRVPKKIMSTYLVFECCEYFLSDIMEQKIDGLFDRAVTKKIFSQIIHALDYLHKNGIMHRDVHPKNLMFRKDGYLKLANFENAREFDSKDLKLEGISKNYHAPEILLKAKKHGPAVDIWAAGCILSEFFLMEFIFPGDSVAAILKKMFNTLGLPNNTIWPGFSSLPELHKYTIQSGHSYNCLGLIFKRNIPQTPQSVALLTEMFIYYPEARIPAARILKHPYFEENPQEVHIEEISRLIAKPEIKARMFESAVLN